MKRDVLNWAEGLTTEKGISKETLNHRGLIEMVSGRNVYESTPEAYHRAYEALGIDIINRVPLENAPPPTPQGENRRDPEKPYEYLSLGVYDTAWRYTCPCNEVDDVWAFDVEAMDYEDLITPVPHPCKAEDIAQREGAIGDVGLYYPMLYTTLFMWGVEVLGWEIFMLAATQDPERFHRHFLLPCVEKSKRIVTGMANSTSAPMVYVHDDLASAKGPIFPPWWYDEFIFPHYPEIWSEAKRLGKKVIYVADGDMTAFLSRLVESGVDGLMFENPATPIEAVIEHFGGSGRFLIGGIETAKLTQGQPDEIREMVREVHHKTRDCPGFALASCGGLHNDIPMENLEAYFDARAEVGVTPADWRTRCRSN